MKRFFSIYTIVSLGLAGALLLPAEERHGLEGAWNVNVTVTDCQGTVLKTVQSVQLFQADGSMAETSNLASRGSSEGVWKAEGDRKFDVSFWFFRYPPPQGPYASFAAATEKIVLDWDNNQFTSSGSIVDNEAGGTTLTSCFTHTATRLAVLDKGDLR